MSGSVGLNAFRTAGANQLDARLKVVDLDKGGQPVASARGFAGKAISWLREHTLLGRTDGRTMATFKNALGAEYDKGSVKQLETAVSQAKKELTKLNSVYNQQGWATGSNKPKHPLEAAAVKEIRTRLELLANSTNIGSRDKLTGSTVKSAEGLTKILHENRNDPMLKMMGPAKFLGYALASEKNIAEADDKFKNAAASMTTCEKVALYGYTCADYSILNRALRNTGETPEPGVKAYADHASAAVKKCPPYTGGATNRSINDPPGDAGWANRRYGNGQPDDKGKLREVVEHAFTSTGITVPTSNYRMVVSGQGYDVAPFSAWPKETEILYPPGTKFEVTQVDQNSPTSAVFHVREVTTNTTNAVT